MKNPPPKNPRVNDTWVDDDGELHVWDGAGWVPYEDPSSSLIDHSVYRIDSSPDQER